MADTVADAVNETAEGPGAALKSAREGLGVSVREVAEALNLPVQIINAMEANDLEHLPAMVFTRGYLRSYARLLEMDPDALVARLPQTPEVETSLTAEMEAIAPKRISLPGVPVWVLAALGVAIVLLLWLLLSWLFSGDEAPAPLPTENEAAIEETVGSAAAARTAANTSGPGSPSTTVIEENTDGVEAEVIEEEAFDAPSADEFETMQPEQAVEEPPQVIERALSTAEQPTAVESQPVESQTQESVTAPAQLNPAIETPAAAATAQPESAPTPAGVRRITAFGDDLLELSFVEDCWVEVKDRDGNLLYGDLNRAGSTLKLIGRAPFRVLLGYAPGVEMIFNDQQIDLVPSIRNNVASVTVGR